MTRNIHDDLRWTDGRRITTARIFPHDIERPNAPDWTWTVEDFDLGDPSHGYFRTEADALSDARQTIEEALEELELQDSITTPTVKEAMNDLVERLSKHVVLLRELLVPASHTAGLIQDIERAAAKIEALEMEVCEARRQMLDECAAKVASLAQTERYSSDRKFYADGIIADALASIRSIKP